MTGFWGVHEEVPDPEGERLFRKPSRAGEDSRPHGCRIRARCFAWGRLLRLGPAGLEAFARSERERREAEGATEATLHFLQGAELVYAAFRAYARRYAAAARAAGLEEAGARCAAIAGRPPRHFAEALQLLWLVGHVYCTMVARNPTLTFGRLDELLLPFYREDIAAGRLAPEEAGDLIEEFYCKNNLILGRGEHQMGGSSEKDTGWLRNLCYDAPQYVVLGGRRRDGAPVANELTLLFLERVVPGFKNPVIVLRWTDDLPEPLWRLACEKMRANASMMVYNDAAVIPALVDAGIAEEDAVTYTMHGCNWPDVPGIQRSVSHCEPPLPKLFLTALLGDEGERRRTRRTSTRYTLSSRSSAGRWRKSATRSARTTRAGTSWRPVPCAWMTASWMDRWHGHARGSWAGCSITRSPARSTHSPLPPTASPPWTSWSSPRAASRWKSCARRFDPTLPGASHCAGSAREPRSSVAMTSAPTTTPCA